MRLSQGEAETQSLDARSTAFYRSEGLRLLAANLHPGGIFGLWSNAPPDPAFTARLASVFEVMAGT